MPNLISTQLFVSIHPRNSHEGPTLCKALYYTFNTLTRKLWGEAQVLYSQKVPRPHAE